MPSCSSFSSSPACFKASSIDMPALVEVEVEGWWMRTWLEVEVEVEVEEGSGSERERQIQ